MCTWTNHITAYDEQGRILGKMVGEVTNPSDQLSMQSALITLLAEQTVNLHRVTHNLTRQPCSEHTAFQIMANAQLGDNPDDWPEHQ